MISSFNPYFTGSNSGSSKVRSSYEHKEEVSILILLEVILEAFLYEQNDRLLLVSILILLEVILEDPGLSSREASCLSFNPYFTGSNSGRVP